MFNAVLIGWYNYYGRFYPSAINPVWKQVNMYLVQWMRRKYKRFYWHKRRAREYLNRIARINPHLFKHWELGIFPAAKMEFLKKSL
jgi:RNA-directed DNA polymerase